MSLSAQWRKAIQLSQRVDLVQLVLMPSFPLCPASVVRNAFIFVSVATPLSQGFFVPITTPYIFLDLESALSF